MKEHESKVGHPSDYGSRTADEPMRTGDGDPLEEPGYISHPKPDVEKKPSAEKQTNEIDPPEAPP